MMPDEMKCHALRLWLLPRTERQQLMMEMSLQQRDAISCLLAELKQKNWPRDLSAVMQAIEDTRPVAGTENASSSAMSESYKDDLSLPAGWRRVLRELDVSAEPGR